MRLVGKRCVLRDWELKDLEVYRKYNTGHHLWMDLDGPYYAKASPSELEQLIQKIKKRIIDGNWQNRIRIVIADKTTDQLLGTVNWYWQSKETNWKSIGIALFDEGVWGKGLGADALKLWVDYHFKQDETLVRLDIRTWSGNKGMIKLAEKIGFVQEACFRKARIVKGEYYDSIGFGILREEWKNNL